MDSNEYLKINIPSTIHYEGSTTKTHIFLKDGYTIDNILKEFDKNGYWYQKIEDNKYYFAIINERINYFLIYGGSDDSQINYYVSNTTIELYGIDKKINFLLPYLLLKNKDDYYDLSNIDTLSIYNIDKAFNGKNKFETDYSYFDFKYFYLNSPQLNMTYNDQNETIEVLDMFVFTFEEGFFNLNPLK